MEPESILDISESQISAEDMLILVIWIHCLHLGKLHAE